MRPPMRDVAARSPPVAVAVTRPLLLAASRHPSRALERHVSHRCAAIELQMELEALAQQEGQGKGEAEPEVEVEVEVEAEVEVEVVTVAEVEAASSGGDSVNSTACAVQAVAAARLAFVRSRLDAGKPTRYARDLETRTPPCASAIHPPGNDARCSVPR